MTTAAKPSDMPGAVLPYGYGARLAVAADPVAVPVLCADCGQRADSHPADSPPTLPDPPVAQAAPSAAVPHARLNNDQRHDVAIALEVASRAARMSSMTKVLTARERDLAERLHDEILSRLFRNVRLSSGPGVTSPTPGPDATP